MEDTDMKNALIFLLILSLTACATPQGVESTSTPEATGTVPPATASPAPTATEDPLYANVVLQLQTQVEGNSYLTRLQDLTGKDLPVECAEAAVQIAEEQQFDFQVTIDPFGDCRVVSNDGKQAIFPNDEGDLYVTEVGGRAFLAGINHSQASNATIKFDNLSGPWYGEMINSETGEVLAVATRDANSQWREMKNGQIVDEVGKPMLVPTATADAGSSEPGKTLDVRVADEATLNALADDILAQERKFPEGMPDFMNWELIDILNEKIEPRPIYFEGVDKNGTKVVEYYDLEKRKMVQLRGSYLEHKDLIDANSITLLRKLQTNPQTGLTSYFDETTQQWVEIKNSQGVDWNFVGSGELDESQVSLPGNPEIREAILELLKTKNANEKRSILQFVVTSHQAAVLKMNQGFWFTMGTIEGFTVQADRDGNPLFGVTTFVAPEVGMSLVYESTTSEKHITQLQVFMQNGDTEFQPGVMLSIVVLDKQEIVWKNMQRSSIDGILNAEKPENAFREATAHSFSQKIIILNARIAWIPSQ